MKVKSLKKIIDKLDPEMEVIHWDRDGFSVKVTEKKLFKNWELILLIFVTCFYITLLASYIRVSPVNYCGNHYLIDYIIYSGWFCEIKR